MPETIIPQDISLFIRDRLDFVRNFAADYPQLDAIVTALTVPQNLTMALTTIHRLQRAYYAAQVGLLVHDVLDAIDHPDFPLWDRYTVLPATDAQKDRLAQLLYEGDTRRQTPVLLNLSDYGRDIGERILHRCVMAGDETDVLIADPLFQRRLLHHCDATQVNVLADIATAPHRLCARRISMRTEQVQQPYPDTPVEMDIQQAYNKAVGAYTEMLRTKFYTVTTLPTPKDAELDQLPYADYIDLFFRMCDVDWAQVDMAHQALIEQLNAGSILGMTNSDGTDVSMNIAGFTFCNSLVAKNVPGSEVFSAPHRDSVHGTVVGKGRYLFNGKLIENITLRFEHGRVVKYSAEIGQDVLTEMIETDDGSHYVGEIGIGTNPVLRTHLVNGLLVEKIGGSFHLALGNCYKFKDYLGTPVNVDNGNTSAIHEDLTFMLYGKQGRMYLDGQLIMDDGRFLDPRLAVLNGVH